MDGMTTNTIDTEIAALLAENDRRNEVMFAKFDPVTGEGSIGKRVRVSIADFAIPVQWLPVEMMNIPLVKKLVKAGSIDKFLSSVMHVEPNDDDFIKVSRTLIRLRYKHDFPFGRLRSSISTTRTQERTCFSVCGIRSASSCRALRRNERQDYLSVLFS